MVRQNTKWSKISIWCLGAIGIWAIGASLVQAQEVRAQASVDSSRYLIGDWINLTLEVEHPGNVTIAWPRIVDSLKPLEVLQHSQPTISQTGMRVFERARWTLAAYDTGVFVIPSIKIPYTRPNDTTKYIAQTSPIPIVVRGVAVDTTQDIKDIKPPLSVPISFAEIFPYLIGILIVGGIAWLVYYVLKKRKRGESILSPPPQRPAHEVALESLRVLDAERLWQRGKVKEYHSHLTDILRTYIERRFTIMAMEMTTEEILSSPVLNGERTSVRLTNRDAGGSPQNVNETLKEILVRADLVKFAKYQPLPEENERSMTLAYSFVESTKPEVAAEQAEVGAPKREKLTV